MAAVDPWTEEVRVALALNGGVSLAVWMGGCAVELDRARRAREGPSTYGVLCEAFRRHLVLDVMSGSSAGGINGALLAGAMCHRRELRADFLRSRWLELGDFAKLLQPLRVSRPQAIMQGRFFADQLELTFAELLNGEPRTDVDQTVPALDVTATDTVGHSVTFRDSWGGTLRAREFRARFRFRTEDEFSVKNLSAAARASASFPFAFETYDVPAGSPRELAGLGDRSWVIDGGLLDNAPIRAALSLIPTRPASRQVKRFLCYLNAEPDLAADPAFPADGPTPASVFGLVLNLPRQAPFVDQLRALQEATTHSDAIVDPVLALLETDLAALGATAERLLATYRRRRRLRFLQEYLADPADARRVFDALERHDAELPWLPDTLATPADVWPWGFQAAARVHHLALDLIRAALPGSSGTDREALLAAREGIDARIEDLDERRRCFETSSVVRSALQRIVGARDEDEAEVVRASVAALAKRAGPEAPVLADGIRDTAHDLFGISVALGAKPGVTAGTCLFGDDWLAPDAGLTPEMLAAFIERVVAVEVIRRSFLDERAIDSAQEIAFAQLTPEAPTPILAAKPFSSPWPASADSKLCGTILGHFGSFYRRSWRANDFMWGRLDAAARIVEMLVSRQRSVATATLDEPQPWARLAAALAGQNAEQCTLLEEALDDLPGAGADLPLEARLHNVLAQDLTEGDGSITRRLCTRAAQFEVLCEELPHLVAEAQGDVRVGARSTTLGLDGLDLATPAGVLEAIGRLRRAETLPAMLGRDDPREHTSDLAVRTLTRAGLVGLGYSRRAGGGAFGPVTATRSVLLPAAGAVSQNVLTRLAVATVFVASSAVLAARVAGTVPTAEVNANALSIPGLLLSTVCLLAVIGTATVPLIRAVWGDRRDRLRHGALSLALLAVGGLGGAALALGGPLRVTHLLVAPGFDPPWWVSVLPVVLGFGGAWMAVGPLRPVLSRFGDPVWQGAPSLALAIVASAIAVAWAADPLIDAWSDGAWWQRATLALAAGSLPLSLVALVLMPWRRSRRAAS